MIKRKKRKFNFIKINEEDIVLSKKGLSSIVATLIIILLVIVVASIIWVVVKNVVQEGSEGVELGKFTLDLQIERAQIEDGDVTVVVVRRNPGKGDFIGMNFIFSDGENSEIIREDSVLQELEERSFTFTLTQISTSNLKTISIAPIFKLSSGKESVGDVTGSFDASGLIPIGANGDGEPMGNFEFLGFKGTGTVDYTISGGQGSINFTRAIVDPLDVLPGDNQTFTVHITSTYSIINVTSFTQLDNSNSTLVFEKISEDEIWSVSWIVNDVHSTTYRTKITATDSEGNSNSITLTWTDSCQSQIDNAGGHGADREITITCGTISDSVGGLDGGNLIIVGGVTMMLNPGSVWAFNDGKYIQIDGTIAMNATGGGSIVKTNLYMRDEDVDGYGLPNVMGITGGSGWVRAMSSSGTDCYDKNASAHPGNNTFRTITRGTSGVGNDAAGNTWNSYDYNCDGSITYQWPENATCQDNCNMGSEGYCGKGYLLGATGWNPNTYGFPYCGQPGDYITSGSIGCSNRPKDDFEACVEVFCYGAEIDYSRTQACR